MSADPLERARELVLKIVGTNHDSAECKMISIDDSVALILAELQAERARTTERIVSFYLIGKSGPAYLYANELRAAGMDKPNEERKYADAK
jgi:hypothetical protein